MIFLSDTEVTVCHICNSTIYEDGTAANCCGDCDREASVDRAYVPLSFDDEGILRELPEPFPFDELEGYEDE